MVMIGALPYLAFTLGLMSSFHCIGMCGPIALALPVRKGSAWLQLTALLAYNGGRILIYTSLGGLLGTVGTSLAWMGYLRFASIIAGLLMLLFVFWHGGINRFLHPPKFWQMAVNRIKQGMSVMLQRRKIQAFLLLGMLNGLLPCGLVYLALISSVAMGSIPGGASYMLLFGLGTMPAMMAVGYLKNWFAPSLRTRIQKFTPILVAVAGIVLIFRGLFIQLPFNTPSTHSKIVVCHGK